MNKRISLGTAIALMFVVAAVTLSATMLYANNKFNRTVSNITEREAMYDKLAEIDTFVRNNYIDDLDEDFLMDCIADAYMIGIRDTYSDYYTAEEYEKISNGNAGSVVGIGISGSRTETGYILVEEVYPDSPAQSAQIQPGELIIKVNDIDLTPETYEEGINAISGKAGTTLSLVVRNGNEDREITEITRRKVQRPSVYSTSFDTVGYVRITGFNGTTYDQFKTAVETNLEEGAESLVFDVRNNGGGTMDAVVKMLDLLLPEGDIITATDKDGNVQVLGTSDPSCVDVPMAVLTNGQTASAAELFTQALRDYGVAKSIGETTYGKGTMQIYHKLKDGSAIKLTTRYYNPPKSENYDGVGIVPDYQANPSFTELAAIADLDPELDNQLYKAIEYLTTGSTTSDPVIVQPPVEEPIAEPSEEGEEQDPEAEGEGEDSEAESEDEE